MYKIVHEAVWLKTRICIDAPHVLILLCPLPSVPDAPRNVFTLLTYQKFDGDDPGQLAHIALDWTPVVRIYTLQ